MYTTAIQLIAVYKKENYMIISIVNSIRTTYRCDCLECALGTLANCKKSHKILREGTIFFIILLKIYINLHIITIAMAIGNLIQDL